MCDVPSIAVFCSESIECFPGIVSKFFFKLLVTIPVAPIISLWGLCVDQFADTKTRDGLTVKSLAWCYFRA